MCLVALVAVGAIRQWPHREVASGGTGRSRVRGRRFRRRCPSINHEKSASMGEARWRVARCFFADRVIVRHCELYAELQ